LGGAADLLAAAAVGAEAWPKIFDIRLLNNPIIFLFLIFLVNVPWAERWLTIPIAAYRTMQAATGSP
jgi:hypothetical protein